MKQKSQIQLQKEIDDFNSKFEVGDYVNVKTDSGQTITDRIVHRATIMGGHTAMAWLEKKGSYILERVSKL